MATVSCCIRGHCRVLNTVNRSYVTRNDIKGKKRPTGKRRRLPFSRIALSRYQQSESQSFNEDNEWSSVHQTSRPFDPYLIKIPVRMGRPQPGEIPPLAITTPEILKIPNFFHLTPPAIQKHCDALKELCTPWPDNLPPLPIRIITRNFVFPSCDIRHPQTRIVQLNVSLKDLSLSSHARQKMIALSGQRYDPQTDEIKLIGEKCPTRKQNREYVMYLLKVLYLESNKVEPWEKEQEMNH